jgi:hypothetical protein
MSLAPQGYHDEQAGRDAGHQGIVVSLQLEEQRLRQLPETIGAASSSTAWNPFAGASGMAFVS